MLSSLPFSRHCWPNTSLGRPIRTAATCHPAYAKPCRSIADDSHIEVALHGECTRRNTIVWAPYTLGWFLVQQTQAAQAAAFPTNIFEALNGSLTFPEPVRFPRKKLDQKFAVLLIRSVYNAVDTLDFMPMDEFQAKFWKYRQSQYEPYLLQYSPLRVQQGDLQDPLYFDFISFAQMATINQEIPKARQTFQEFCEDCPDQKRIVTRNPQYRDNALLPAAVQQIAGDAIIKGDAFDALSPSPAATHIKDLAKGIQQILDIFVDRGFALKASVSSVAGQCSEASCEYHGAGSQGEFQIRMEGPANLWGLGALASQGSKLSPDFAAMAVAAYLRASGLKSQYTTERTASSVVQTWNIV